ncbi:MAG: antitoxin [Nocardioidaceae bacterium]|nr:antitoxin [Nocardioidaceae bacterium]
MGLLDKFKGAKGKVGDLVAEHGDKVESGLDKAGDFINDKTGGKYADKIGDATGKAKDALGKLDDGGDAAGGPPKA